MTQLILTQSNYLTSLLKTAFTKVQNTLGMMLDSIVEARQKQANVEVARQLMGNRDFAEFSFSEILAMVETGNAFPKK